MASSSSAVGYRKRKYVTTIGGKRARQRTMVKVVPGYTRTAGNYGRYIGRGGVERLYFDTQNNDAVVNSTGQIVDSVCIIEQGNGEQNRHGLKCTLRSLHIRYTWTLNTTSTPGNTSDIGRLIIYIDRQCNGAAAAVLDILATAAWNQFLNLKQSHRFHILKDETCDLASVAGAYDGTNDQFGEHTVEKQAHFKLNLPLIFESSTPAIADLVSNNIGMLLITKSGYAQFDSRVRVRFTDQ